MLAVDPPFQRQPAGAGVVPPADVSRLARSGSVARVLRDGCRRIRTRRLGGDRCATDGQQGATATGARCEVVGAVAAGAEHDLARAAGGMIGVAAPGTHRVNRAIPVTRGQFGHLLFNSGVIPGIPTHSILGLFNSTLSPEWFRLGRARRNGSGANIFTNSRSNEVRSFETVSGQTFLRMNVRTASLFDSIFEQSLRGGPWWGGGKRPEVCPTRAGRSQKPGRGRRPRGSAGVAFARDGAAAATASRRASTPGPWG